MADEKSGFLKTGAATISAVAMLLGSVWAIDSHYASAADVEKIQKSVDSKITQFQQQHLENQVFLLDMKKQQQNGKLDPVDAAMAERYRRQLQQLDNNKSDK